MHLSTRLQRASDDDITTLQLLYACPSLPLATRMGLFRDESLLNVNGTLSRLGRFAAKLTLKDCSLCGGECRTPFPNRRSEWFCSKSHREQSNRQLNEYVTRDDSERLGVKTIKDST